MFYLTIVNKTRRHCHSWLAGHYVLISSRDIYLGAYSRLGMSVTTQGGSGQQFVTGL